MSLHMHTRPASSRPDAQHGAVGGGMSDPQASSVLVGRRLAIALALAPAVLPWLARAAAAMPADTPTPATPSVRPASPAPIDPALLRPWAREIVARLASAADDRLDPADYGAERAGLAWWSRGVANCRRQFAPVVPAYVGSPSHAGPSCRRRPCAGMTRMQPRPCIQRQTTIDRTRCSAANQRGRVEMSATRSVPWRSLRHHESKPGLARTGQPHR